MSGAERARISAVHREEWRRFGPYLPERAWGTVREDYSVSGDAWTWFPHDHARSRAYRWNDDGMAGLCDETQHLCLALALWNGVDPILKERMFGLTGPEGNHGEDVKEYWWYLDATPSSSWLRWRYHYPQRPFPYDDLVRTNLHRGKHEPEYELADTGVFDDGRYWVVTVDYAKAGPADICMRVVAENVGPEPATLHVLPHLWFHNSWSWSDPPSGKPSIARSGDALVATHRRLGTYHLTPAPGPDGRPPTLLFCENDTNTVRIWGADEAATPFPKDGINDHVVHGASTVNPAEEGTKAAAWYVLEVPAGESREVRLRFQQQPSERPADLGTDFDAVMAARLTEADEFYEEVIPAVVPEEERAIARQAFAGMLWSMKHYHYDVARWLDGDSGSPPPPAIRRWIRNGQWRHLKADDVLSMPDPWEYPWFATWDLAFHTVVLAHVDPELAKEQLILLCREWYMHPNGQLPAYEWQFSDVNPPVHAWAALEVFELDGGTDWPFLRRIFLKLMANFTWWLNLKDADEDSLFEGGFLGLDNIGPFDRSKPLDAGARLQQADATAWMVRYALDMLSIAVRLAEHDPVYEDLAIKFLLHFARIADALNDGGMWDDEEGFYFDQVLLPDGQSIPVKVRSMVGLLATTGVATFPASAPAKLGSFARQVGRRFEETSSFYWGKPDEGDGDHHLLAIVDPERLRVVLGWVLDEERFLSPGGLRSLSRIHRERPFTFTFGSFTSRVDYEPAESSTSLFGGNSNWRGPVWFPVNHLFITSLRRYHQHLGDAFTVECPVGSGVQMNLAQVADHLSDRLVSIFREGPDGRRPLWGGVPLLADDPRWRDQLLFFEYFHGDTSAGLGASHQTGWTGLVADLILRDHGVVEPR